MGMQIILKPERVNAIFIDCLFRDGEDAKNHVEVSGTIRKNVRFHPGRLQSHRNEIKTLLDELPDEFKKSGSGGRSFFNAHNDKHGNRWTDNDPHVEELFQLGIGIGRVQYKMPKEKWSINLPGGMPYCIVD